MAKQPPQTPKRRDTRLRAEGAEFLVLAHLLMNDITASKAYVRFPGYDIIATDADHGTSVRIQVKSRSDTYERAFPITNFECEFVVWVKLRREHIADRGEGDSVGRTVASDIYVLPVEVAQAAWEARRSREKTPDSFNKLHLGDIPDVERYRDAFELIRERLRELTAAPRKPCPPHVGGSQRTKERWAPQRGPVSTNTVLSGRSARTMSGRASSSGPSHSAVDHGGMRAPMVAGKATRSPRQRRSAANGGRLMAPRASRPEDQRP